jgi:hypothetical protein
MKGVGPIMPVGRRRIDMNRQSLVALLLASIGLAGCGGGGGTAFSTDVPNRVASVPPPPPAPATPPFGTPDSWYNTVGAGIDGQLSATTGSDGRIAVTGISATPPAFAPAMALHYVGPDRYELQWDMVATVSFGPADRVASGGPFEVYRQTVAPNAARGTLEIARPEALQLTYASLGNFAVAWGAPQGGTVEGSVGYFVAGSPTGSAQLPITGRARYAGSADGLWIDGATVRRLFGSTAVLEADFATGDVTSTLNLVGRADPFGNFTAAPATTLGIFVGTGRLAATTNSSFRYFNGFSGNYAAVAGYSGTFNGHFFGPAANEAGFNFRLTGGPGQVVFGAAAGRQ